MNATKYNYIEIRDLPNRNKLHCIPVAESASFSHPVSILKTDLLQFNPLSANPTKLSNTLKTIRRQFADELF